MVKVEPLFSIREKVIRMSHVNPRRFTEKEVVKLLNFTKDIEYPSTFRRTILEDVKIMPVWECIYYWADDKHGMWRYDERTYWVVQIAWNMFLKNGENIDEIITNGSKYSYCSPR